MFIVLDLETSGTDPFNDKIIELSIIKVNFNDFYIIDTFSSLINPDIQISEIITQITKINNDMLKNAPSISDLSDKIIDFVGDLPILGHNIEFDINFLKQNSIDFSSNKIMDTMYLANFLLNDYKSLSLESLSLQFGIDISGAHRSRKDVELTLNIFKELIKKLKNLTKEKQEILYYLLQSSNDYGLDLICKKYLGKIEKKDKSYFIKILLGKSKVLKKNNIIENSGIKINNINTILSTIKGLEIRENQQKMIKLVDNCLDNKAKIVIEAPTGLGKTFAYLLPSIFYSLKNNTQIFISTTTKTLQDQIYYKDLKFLKDNLNIDFSYTKIKGKNNYFSYYSFFDYLDSFDFFNNKELSFFLKISFWILETNSFELDELEYLYNEYEFKRQINADNLIIFSNKNNFLNKEPIVIARKNVKNSNIVILNNSLLFQDISQEGNILGSVENLILDEAHNLEDVVTNSLKKGFFKQDLEKILNRILKFLKIKKLDINNYIKVIDDLLFNVSLLFDNFYSYFNFKNLMHEKSILLEDDFWNNYIDKNELEKLIKVIKSDFMSIIDKLNILPEDTYIEINREVNLLNNIIDIIDTIMDKKGNNNFIKIINLSEYKGIGLEYSVLNIGDFLEKKLWSKLDSVVLTSATLSIGDDFSYLKNLLFLNNFNFFSLETDFDYSKQALVFMPNNIGYIKNNIGEIIEFLGDFFGVIKGQSLVLFSALKTIKEVFIGLKYKSNDLNILAQGIGGSKYKILSIYEKNYKDSIIMGSDSFWEGINLESEKLRFLIIHKIPFGVPSDPIFKARSKLFDNSFRDYSIPKAIIKLKQGFGRLIRTKTDSGVIILLDDRVFSTSWGSEFYKAFSKDIKIKIGTKESFFKILRLVEMKK